MNERPCSIFFCACLYFGQRVKTMSAMMCACVCVCIDRIWCFDYEEVQKTIILQIRLDEKYSLQASAKKESKSPQVLSVFLPFEIPIKSNLRISVFWLNKSCVWEKLVFFKDNFLIRIIVWFWSSVSALVLYTVNT